MAFDKDTLQTLNVYFSKIAILLAPGMAIVEFVFHKGLLTGNIHDIPELILLIIWSLVFSSPYYASVTIIGLWIDTSSDSNEYEVELPLALLLVFVTFVTYKGMLWLNWLHFYTYLGIKREYVFCIA